MSDKIKLIVKGRVSRCLVFFVLFCFCLFFNVIAGREKESFAIGEDDSGVGKG